MTITVNIYLDDAELAQLNERVATMRQTGIEDAEKYTVEDEINYIVRDALNHSNYAP